MTRRSEDDFGRRVAAAVGKVRAADAKPARPEVRRSGGRDFGDTVAQAIGKVRSPDATSARRGED